MPAIAKTNVMEPANEARRRNRLNRCRQLEDRIGRKPTSEDVRLQPRATRTIGEFVDHCVANVENVVSRMPKTISVDEATPASRKSHRVPVSGQVDPSAAGERKRIDERIFFDALERLDKETFDELRSALQTSRV